MAALYTIPGNGAATAIKSKAQPQPHQGEGAEAVSTAIYITSLCGYRLARERIKSLSLELFAEFGGLKIRGLDLVSGKIDKLKLENTPWDTALTEVAHKLNLRAEISGSYVTLVPEPDNE